MFFFFVRVRALNFVIFIFSCLMFVCLIALDLPNYIKKKKKNIEIFVQRTGSLLVYFVVAVFFFLVVVSFLVAVCPIS